MTLLNILASNVSLDNFLFFRDIPIHAQMPLSDVLAALTTPKPGQVSSHTTILHKTVLYYSTIIYWQSPSPAMYLQSVAAPLAPSSPLGVGTPPPRLPHPTPRRTLQLQYHMTTTPLETVHDVLCGLCLGLHLPPGMGTTPPYPARPTQRLAPLYNCSTT